MASHSGVWLRSALLMAAVVVVAAPAALTAPVGTASPGADASPVGSAFPSAQASPGMGAPVLTALRFGDPWRGRLPDVGDVAHLGFSLPTPQHVSLRLGQPRDADVEVRLASGDREVLRQRALEPGTTLLLDLWLDAGEHVVSLRPTQPAEGRYRVLLSHQDPFAVPADIEPNGEPALARDVPASLRWTGGPAGAELDIDGYWLPALGEPSGIRIHVDGEPPLMRLFADSERRQPIELAASGDMVVADEVPAGQELYLEVVAEAPYAIDLEAAGWAPVEDPLAPPVELELELDVPEDFSCAADPVSVPGRLTVIAAGAQPLELEVRTASSDPGWQLDLASTSLRLAPGESVSVPLSLAIQPDSCSLDSVALSLAAEAPDGGLVSSTVVLDAAELRPGVVIEAWSST